MGGSAFLAYSRRNAPVSSAVVRSQHTHRRCQRAAPSCAHDQAWPTLESRDRVGGADLTVYAGTESATSLAGRACPADKRASTPTSGVDAPPPARNAAIAVIASDLAESLQLRERNAGLRVLTELLAERRR
jgi:hypothetical protein